MIDQSGIYTIPASDYHADNFLPDPSLSSSIARILIQDSPMHAKAAHPRLTEQPVREEGSRLDLGTIAHALILEGADVAQIIDAENYRTKAAQDARDEARAAGKFPILAREMPQVIAMIQACRRQLDQHKEASNAFTGGQPEQTIVWQEPNGIWCRCRPDWLHNPELIIDDYKTTSGSAHPDQVTRNLFRDGWDITAAFYLRGLRAVLSRVNVPWDISAMPYYRFIVQETFAPYALSVIGLGDAVMSLAEEKVQYAIDTFGKCLNSGVWPGYPQFVCSAELPSWEEQKWLATQ